MVETLKNSINYYKNNLVKTPNLQIIETIFNECEFQRDLYLTDLLESVNAISENLIRIKNLLKSKVIKNLKKFKR
jgi:hypothetical protein